MNTKAESFVEYLKKQEITCFQQEEFKEDDTVVFRSNFELNGQTLPTIFVLDNSVYGSIQVQVAPQALKEENALELYKYVNDLNITYKPFKYNFNENGDLILSVSLIRAEDTVDGEFIYAIFDVILKHLDEVYGEFMKRIWK